MRSIESILRDVVPKFQLDEIAPLKQLLGDRTDLVVVDGGANAGVWTRCWFNVFGDRTRRAYVFEPQADARVFSDGRTMFSSTELEKMTFCRQGLSNTVGEAIIYRDSEGSPLASLHQKDISGWGPTLDSQERIALTTLDRFLNDNNIGSIDVFKLDVEGHELAAIEGALESIAARKVNLIVFEFGQTCVHSRVFFKDFWALLSPLGFSFAFLKRDGSGGMQPIEKYEYKWERFLNVSIYVVYRQP